jgi:hypothetical protein
MATWQEQNPSVLLVDDRSMQCELSGFGRKDKNDERWRGLQLEVSLAIWNLF